MATVWLRLYASSAFRIRLEPRVGVTLDAGVDVERRRGASVAQKRLRRCHVDPVSREPRGERRAEVVQAERLAERRACVAELPRPQRVTASEGLAPRPGEHERISSGRLPP